jgi:hypothetical protein
VEDETKGREEAEAEKRQYGQKQVHHDIEIHGKLLTFSLSDQKIWARIFFIESKIGLRFQDP